MSLLAGQLVAPAGLIGLEEWKAAARQGKAPAQAVLRKQYVADSIKATGGADARKLTFTITTGAVDRDHDSIKVDGWDLANWLKNPVVLWAHQYAGLPVAKGESAIVTAGALKSTAEFASAEVYPFAETVYRMLLGGFLRAVSVGFRVAEWSYDEERNGYDLLKQELLEYSIVPVPANPEALMDAKSAGIDVAPLKSWCEQVLDGIEPGLWVPKEQALAAFKVLGSPKTVVPALPDTKGGRTFSAANAERIKSAHEACTKAISHLQECMDQMDEDEDEPEDEASAKATATAPAQTVLTQESLQRALKRAPSA